MPARISSALFPLLCACLIGARPLSAQVGAGCPDTRASLVPAAETVLLPWRTCYLKIEIGGVSITLPWSRCPTGHAFVQAHQECLGEFARGMRCEEAGFVPVWLQLCRCVPHAGHSFSFSRCECSDAGAMGFVGNAQTNACH
jgi:hypothetical protein